ncbi:MAG: metallophosphoesterase family protein [Acidimicrobiales bacterium]
MRIAALGDAHLGRSYLPYTQDGVNVRELDFEASFEAAVDLALAQEPDAIVWLGDVFDHPRPTYRSFRLAQRALTRVRDHGVPGVVITGNHDTPRLPGTGNPYAALDDTFGDRIHFVHQMRYQRIELPGLVVHAVPQMLSAAATVDALDEAASQRDLDRSNLLLAHPLVPSVERRYADINEIEVDDRLLRADLVLLGHYHTHTRVRPGVWYAGSTDTFTFADDPGQAKGIVVLDTDTGACRHVPLPHQRPLVTLATVDALGLSPAEVAAQVLERAAAVPEGAVARLYLDGVDPEAYRLLDLESVRAAAGAALHLKIEPSFVEAARQVEDLADLASMPARWASYVAGQDLTGFDSQRIGQLGHDYLVRAVEEAG